MNVMFGHPRAGVPQQLGHYLDVHTPLHCLGSEPVAQAIQHAVIPQPGPLAEPGHAPAQACPVPRPAVAVNEDVPRALVNPQPRRHRPGQLVHQTHLRSDPDRALPHSQPQPGLVDHPIGGPQRPHPAHQLLQGQRPPGEHPGQERRRGHGRALPFQPGQEPHHPGHQGDDPGPAGPAPGLVLVPGQRGHLSLPVDVSPLQGAQLARPGAGPVRRPQEPAEPGVRVAQEGPELHLRHGPARVPFLVAEPTDGVLAHQPALHGKVKEPLEHVVGPPLGPPAGPARVPVEPLRRPGGRAVSHPRPAVVLGEGLQDPACLLVGAGGELAPRHFEIPAHHRGHGLLAPRVQGLQQSRQAPEGLAGG
jgi:hypothetical protein